jgi:acyl transferase domain-containing protein
VTESSIQTTRLDPKKKLQVTHVNANPQPIVFIFTGQGAAYPAMASDLYKSSTQFRADMNHFNEIPVLQGFPPILALIDGAMQNLDQVSPVQMQVSLVCIQIWASWGIKPASVTGHSSGEYVAMQVSSVLSVSVD